jgi:hypothetical protein
MGWSFETKLGYRYLFRVYNWGNIADFQNVAIELMKAVCIRALGLISQSIQCRELLDIRCGSDCVFL